MRYFRIIFTPRIGEVKGGWRNLPSEERHKVFHSKCAIRMIEKRRK
jgi:hypothetical protein